MFGLPLPPPPPDESPQKQHSRSGGEAQQQPQQQQQQQPAASRSTMHSSSNSLSPGEAPNDASSSADSVHLASLRLQSSLLESSVDEQLALPLTSRQPAVPDDDPSGAHTNRSDGVRFASGAEKDELMARMRDEIEDDPAMVEEGDDDEAAAQAEAEAAEQELFLNLQRQQQQQHQQQGGPAHGQGLLPATGGDEFDNGTPRVDEHYYATQRARIEAQMEEQEAQLAARPDVLAPPASAVAGAAGTGASTSAIISALHLRVAQLESGVASRDAEIDQLQRNLAASKTAAAAAAAKAGPKSPSHATSPSTSSATTASMARRSSMDGMEGDPGAAPPATAPPAAGAATPTTTEEDEFEAAIAAEAAAASYGKTEASTAEESSMGTSILAAVSPATLSYSDRGASKAGVAGAAGSGVIALKQHHALITSMAIRFDVEYSRVTRSNGMLLQQIEALQKEVKATALHADTMAIEAENACSRSQELTQALIDARQAARDSAVLDGQAFALEVARKDELGRELEALEDALHEEQVRADLLQGRLDDVSSINEQLKASQALLVSSLSEMTAARDQESFDRNELALKCTALEAEYEKVERILEEYQRAQMMGEHATLNTVLFGVPAATSRKDVEEKTSEQQLAGGESSRISELYTSRFIPPPATGVGGGASTNAAWLAQHELQHLYFSSEKKKWRAEARNLSAQSEHWKDRYETLQKNHYALVEKMERINARERAKIGQQRRAASGSQTMLPAQAQAQAPQDSNRSSFSLAGDDIAALINDNTANDSSAAAQSHGNQQPALPSASPAVTAAALVLTDDLVSPRSGVPSTAGGSEVHMVAAGEVEQVRAEVRRLIYFLQRDRRRALGDKLAPPKKTSSHQLLLSPRNGGSGSGSSAAPANPGDGHSSSLPLLPPMPSSLPSMFVPDFILLEESLRDLSRKLDTCREENQNLNSMMQLVMEPWYKIDADEDARRAAESNQLIVVQGLATEVEQREVELMQSLRALDAERKAKEASDAAYEARLDDLTQLLADTRTEAGLSSKERSAAHARALEHLRAEIALLQSERTAAQVAANTWEQKFSEEREAHLASGGSSGGGSAEGAHADKGSAEMQQQLAALQAKHRATLLEREAAHAQSLETARLLGGAGGSSSGGAIQLQAHLDELAALRKAHAQELDDLRAQSAREASALLAGARPSRIVSLTPDDAATAAAGPVKKCRFHAQPSASEEQPLTQMDPLAPSKLFVSSTLGLLAPVPGGSSNDAAAPASGGGAFLDGSAAQLARSNRAALEAKQQEVDSLRVSVATLTTELAHSKLRASDLEAQIALLHSLGSDETSLASSNLALERDRVRELSKKVAALELLRSRTMTRAEIELQRVQAQAALSASGSFSPRGSAPANLAALPDAQACRAFEWILTQSRMLGEADPAAAAAVAAEPEPVSTARKAGPAQAQGADTVGRSAGAPRVVTGEEEEAKDDSRSAPRRLIAPSSDVAGRSAGATAEVDERDRASERVSSSAAASATAAASAAATAAAAAASAVKASNDMAASSASRLSERELQLSAKEAALQALQDHLTSEESLLASLRLRLDHDTASLAKSQSDFQSYLANSHRELDQRLLAIQSAEASLGTRDAEILSEVSILNAKIGEYNRKASELNARTEELKRRRVELREEKLAWANIKTSRMQGIAANLGMGSSLQAASARANIDSAGAASTTASTMHMHARNIHVGAAGQGQAPAELSQSSPSRFVSPTSVGSSHSSASPPPALPALPLPLPPSPGQASGPDETGGRVSPTAAAAAATAAARARAYGSAGGAASLLSPGSAARPASAFSSPPPSSTGAASTSRLLDFGSSPTSAALFSPMSPMHAHSHGFAHNAAAGIAQKPI